MQLNHAAAFSSTDGLKSQSTFSIKADAAAFNILSSALYSNKPRAIVREIGSNARDAHFMVNKEKTPFEVFVPSWDKPEFRVKDFGPGLSPNMMHDLFTTYFGSNKRSDNVAIGGFGLGCKSPLSLVDQFSVISAHNGITTTWACYKDAAGLPTIAEVNSEPSHPDWPSGVEVIVPIKSEHIRDFQTEILDVFKTFDLRPKLRNYAVSTVEGLKVKSKTPDIIHVHNDNAPARALCGGVVYPIDLEQLKQKTTNKTITDGIEIVHAFGGYWKCPIGSVDVTPSREHLQYTPQTIRTLSDIADRALKDHVDTFKKEFVDVPLTWELAASNHRWKTTEVSYGYHNRRSTSEMLFEYCLNKTNLKVTDPARARKLKETIFNSTLSIDIKQAVTHTDTITTYRKYGVNKTHRGQVQHLGYRIDTDTKIYILDARHTRYINERCRQFVTSNDAAIHVFPASLAQAIGNDKYEEVLTSFVEATLGHATLLTETTLPGYAPKLTKDGSPIKRKKGTWSFPLTKLVTGTDQTEVANFRDVTPESHPYYLTMLKNGGYTPYAELLNKFTITHETLYSVLIGMRSVRPSSEHKFPNFFVVPPNIPERYNLKSKGFQPLPDTVNDAFAADALAHGTAEDYIKTAFLVRDMNVPLQHDHFADAFPNARRLVHACYHGTALWKHFIELPHNDALRRSLERQVATMKTQHANALKHDPWLLDLMRLITNGGTSCYAGPHCLRDQKMPDLNSDNKKSPWETWAVRWALKTTHAIDFEDAANDAMWIIAGIEHLTTDAARDQAFAMLYATTSLALTRR